MKTPKLHEAVYWIAHNDNAGGGDDEETVAGYLSTVLVADLFGIDAIKVAYEVMKTRYHAGLPVGDWTP